ncbi:MAG TPA: riboflavin biosynthesis protein RibF [Opitutaceae bacterium]|jgi:riboflavin kinase/FMN adenylyltransferase|nr:riboflavin biosynthesis protein RibF [Opitutaceae bacterium]
MNATFSSLEQAAALPPRPLHLAIGMFDGVHLGHRAVIEAAVQSAHRSGGIAAVLTFFPHPSSLFHPENPTRLIMPPTAKAHVLFQLGVDAVIEQPFTRDFAGILAEEFLPHLRRALPQLSSIYVGENWRFGRGRRGDVPLLVAEGHRLGLTVFSAPRVNLDGEPISSTRLRALIVAGEMAAANTLLGYTYFSEGTVVPGARLGRQLGFPTLNLGWEPELWPRFGVYTVRVSGAKSPAPLAAVANYGLRPTVGKDTRPRLEAHVLGPCPFGEGDTITVEWLHFLRPEKKFAGAGELRVQIGQDVAAARAEFGLPSAR